MAIHAVHLGRHLAQVMPDRLTTSHLRAYLARRRAEITRFGRPPRRASLMKELGTLRSAMRHARDIGLISCDMPPLPRKALPRDERPPRRLLEEEVQAIIAAGYQRDSKLAELLTVLAWSGRRPVAVFHAAAEDAGRVQDGEMFWRRDKGGVGRGWGPLTQPAKEALLDARARKPVGPLFATRDQTIYSAQNFHRRFKSVVEQAGLVDVQLYDLRRFACTQIVRASPSLEVAAQFTGHSETRTLLRYVFAGEGEALELAPRIGWTPAPLRAVDER